MNKAAGRGSQKVEVVETEVQSILTRTGGFLDGVASHSLQPYRGCAYGRSLCGVGCYVRHNFHVTRGRPWGSFLEARTNAAQVYRAEHAAERRWSERRGIPFGVFMSSSTDPFVPQESRCRISHSVLEAMIDAPPDLLILQTHSHHAEPALPLMVELSKRCRARLHLSIETDRDRIEGLPPHASPVERRLETAAAFRAAGVFTVITVAPLLPIADPERFFERIGRVADACVLDHFVGGDGTPDGGRTRKTLLPLAMEAVHPGSADREYLAEMTALARWVLPGRVGVHRDGFAGRYA